VTSPNRPWPEVRAELARRRAARPRYRVLARPWRDHLGSDDPDDPTGGHDAGCVSGWELLVTAPRPGGTGPPGADHEVLGVTQVTGARLDPAVARATVVDYLRTLADPLPTGVRPADVELYEEVP
jgi:hypothetical protein